MLRSDCDECIRLMNEVSSALVDHRYCLDALTMTRKKDPEYGSRSKLLHESKRRLRAAQKQRTAHFSTHGD